MPEMTQQMDPLVSGFVDTVPEFFAAELAAWNGEFDVDGGVDGKGGQVGDVFEISLTFEIGVVLALVLQFHNLQVTSGGHEFRQTDTWKRIIYEFLEVSW